MRKLEWLVWLALVACTTDFRAIQASNDVQAPRDAGRDADHSQHDASAPGDGDGDGDDPPGDGDGDGDPAGDGDGGSTPPLECVRDLALGRNTADTTDGEQRFELSCRSGSGNELAYELRIEDTDYYRFSTADSSIDTALAIFEPSCDGAELACNDNAGSSLHSELVRRFTAGERAIVVASGNAGEDGAITLEVERVQCPELDLSNAVLPTTKTTEGGDNAHGGACGGELHPERAYRFVPDTTSLYRFSVTSDAFDPALYLQTGPVCGGAALGCGFSQKGQWAAEITRKLTAGEPVTVIVDGRDGEGLFELDIDAIAASCPDSGEAHATGTLQADSLHIMSTSCAPSGGQDYDGYVPLKDHSYALSHEIGFGGTCRYSVLSDLPLAVSLLSGPDCAGSEKACAVSVDLGETAVPRYEASFQLSHEENGNYVMVIESTYPLVSVAYEIPLASCIL